MAERRALPPPPETMRPVRCPACRGLGVKVRTSRQVAGHAMSRVHCQGCGYTWPMKIPLQRVLVALAA